LKITQPVDFPSNGWEVEISRRLGAQSRPDAFVQLLHFCSQSDPYSTYDGRGSSGDRKLDLSEPTTGQFAISFVAPNNLREINALTVMMFKG